MGLKEHAHDEDLLSILEEKMTLHRIMKKEVASELGRHHNTITLWTQNMTQDRFEIMMQAVDRIIQDRLLEQLKRERGLASISNLEFLERMRKNGVV